ncbi:MAG: ligase-associated DNA damage response exonuclease, partial [Proteobacteria bacterium]
MMNLELFGNPIVYTPTSESDPLVQWTESGLYCAAGGFYIDPHRVVDVAVVTHAHSDHARRGSRQYYCERSGVGVLKSRLGTSIQVCGVPYREPFQLGRVKVSFHSAGHILGSAQVRIESDGEVWVLSGDYKRDRDPSCEPFEVVECDTFVTEATFGTPKFVWEKNRNHGQDISEWWAQNRAIGKNSLLFGYSLGKAQRILAELAPYAARPVLVHASIEEINRAYRSVGVKLATTLMIDHVPLHHRLVGELILAPPSILKTDWLSRLGSFETAFASGWMQGQESRWGRAVRYDRGFVMSDHADWNDLVHTIQQ